MSSNYYYSSVKNNISEEATATNGSSNAGNCCSRASSELKLYQAFIFSVPIFFTFILLLLFYLFYLRRRRVDWSSLRMRAERSITTPTNNEISRCELGLKKELREMLPIIVFKESFYVKDTQCSVCLCDFQAEERLQQIPACGHTFHMDCIDLWLATHTTCPLCRHSLTSTKAPFSNVVVLATEVEGNDEISSLAQNGGDEVFIQNNSQSNVDPQTSVHSSRSRNSDERIVPSVSERGEDDDQLNQHGTDTCDNNTKSET